jgi:hypothetical protein
MDRLASVLGVLDWSAPRTETEALRTDFDTLLAHRWWALTARPEDEGLRAALALLPLARRRRLLRAPWLSDLLARREGPHLDARRAANWLLAEVACLVPPQTEAATLWTCHGDTRIGDDGLPEPHGLPEVPGLTIDDASPRTFPHRDHGGNDIALLPRERRADVRRAIAAALAVASAHRPTVGAFIRDFTEVLALRADLEDREVFRSGTFDRYIGLVFLTNPHLDRIDREGLVNALLHESIHGFLFTAEVVRGWFVRTADPRGLSLRSPWTGARLALPSYVHACLVWYGLHQFWQGVCDSGAAGFDVARARALRDTSARGFGARPAAQLDPFREHLDPDVLALLHAVDARMAAP